ncbi:MAG: hypothetical protein UZ16_OP3001000796 [Candidatus Hinthialibacteria bacterium OLB16]|jgi:hypothetical protein|nr:MAG: hypothetical protein UZ16_OP3001000796 [Candidatus Hinthialibacteria bacterium OLB16]
MKKSLVVTGLVLGLACAFVVFTPGIAQAHGWSIGIGPGYIGVGHGHGHGHGGYHGGYYGGGYHGGYHGHGHYGPVYHGGYYPVYSAPVYGGCYGPSWGFSYWD